MGWYTYEYIYTYHIIIQNSIYLSYLSFHCTWYPLMIYRIMQELPWITIFGHSWKSLGNHIMSDKKIVIHGNECIILFLTCYFMSWTPFSPRTVFSDLALWRHHGWSVTSRERDVPAWSSCTRKSVQKRPPLVNNNHEYRFLITRYSWFSV